MRYFCRSLVAALAAYCSTFAQAQTPNEHAISYSALDSEIKPLHQEAMGRRYVHVLVDLAIDNSLAAFQKNPSPDFNRVQDAVLQNIEGDYLTSSPG